MNAPDLQPDWVGANQRLMVAEIARLSARLDADAAAEADARAEVDAARAALPLPAAIDVLGTRFGLSAFERDIVLLAAGIEMDSRLAAHCNRAAGAPQRPDVTGLTFGLALATLADPHWSALSPQRPLRRWRLLQREEGTALTTSRLQIDEAVLHFLAGLDFDDARLAPWMRPLAGATPLAASHQRLCDQLARSLPCAPLADALVQLHGDDADAREAIAGAVASQLGWRLQALDLQALPAVAADVAGLETLWQRQSALGNAALLVDCGGDPPGAALAGIVERLAGLVFIVSAAPLTLRRTGLSVAVPTPDADEQRQLWQHALGSATPTGELDAVVAQFRWGAGRIARTAAALQGRPLTPGELWRACRDRAPARLSELAQRVVPQASWDDLVLPEAQKLTLAQIAVHMRHRFQVHEGWGFAGEGARGLGITALFAGDSGTGKTLAAEVLAGVLDLELFRIDLSAVVSKYIGETEKNLKRVFDAAEDSAAILLFDEADALFGKRSEVKDSHDRYANIEVSYLLQRMECYRGLAILTTNHKAALDAAFTRRLRFIVQFPFPEATEREAIWRRAFPARTPTQGLAWAKLARLQAAGGHIRNIALGAAFHAADAGQAVGMEHVLRAARADAAKRERAMADSETRGWV